MSLEQRILLPTLELLASHLHACNVENIFGIIGDPITPFVSYCEQRGIKFYAFRNEQAASYASSAISFLSANQQIGVALTVAGPGFTNALTGLANASTNGWPCMLVCPLVTGDTHRFQAMLDQQSVLSSVAKECVVYDGSVGSVIQCMAMARTPFMGSSVLFIPVVAEEKLWSKYSESKQYLAQGTPALFSTFIQTKLTKPLLIIGNETTMYPDMQDSIRGFIERNNIPFIAESMARGVVPESHPLCAGAARSFALSACENLIVLGTTLDWMWSSTFRKNQTVKVICFSNKPGIDTTYSLDAFTLFSGTVGVSDRHEWVIAVQTKGEENKRRLTSKITTPQGRLASNRPSHWEAIGIIRSVISETNLDNSLIVSEGANTMDVARIALDKVSVPRKRMDAGKWGAMGGALGYVVAACAIQRTPDYSPVVCILGDSAFGFAGAELETLVRYKCNCLIIVFNNGGIYTGSNDNATRFNQYVKHDLVMQGFGGIGFSTRDIPLASAYSIKTVLLNAIAHLKEHKGPVLVEILIDHNSGTHSGSLSRM